jgi:DNA polymerase-3 subunit delta
VTTPVARLPAYLVKGDDPVLRSEAVRSLVDELVGEDDRSLVVEEVDVASDDTPDTAGAVDAARTPPFLSDHRVVVVRNIGAAPSAGLQPLLAYLEDPSPTASVVLVTGGSPGAGGRPSGRGGERSVLTALTKAVKEVGRVIDASAPHNAKGRDVWLRTHLADAPVRLDGAAIALVDAHLGEDLGRLENLLAAVAAAYGVGARVGADDVRPFLGEAGAVPPWELTDAIDSGRTDVALGALRRMVAAGERHPLVIIATLHGHFGRMLRLDGSGATSADTAAAVLGVKKGASTFPAKKAFDQGRRLGPQRLHQAIQLLAEADLDLKGASGLDDGIVLDVLVARLCRLAPRSKR